MSKIPKLLLIAFSVWLSAVRAEVGQYCSKRVEHPDYFDEKGLRAPIECGACPMMNLPCDFSTLPEIPEILIVGEKHDDLLSKEVKVALAKAAAKGLIPVGTEGWLGQPFLPWNHLDTPQSLMQGIESPAPHAIVQTYYLQNHFLEVSDNQSMTNLLSEIKIRMTQYPLFRDAFRELKAEAKGGEMREFLIGLDREVYGDQVKAVHQPSAEIIREFANGLHIKIIEMANDPSKPYRCQLGDKALHTLLTSRDRWEVGIDEDSRANTMSYAYSLLLGDNSILRKVLGGQDLFRVLVKVRDRDFAREAASMVCKYAGKQKGLVLIVGEDHFMNERDLPYWIRFMTGNRASRFELLKSRLPNEKDQIMDFVRRHSQEASAQ